MHQPQQPQYLRTNIHPFSRTSVQNISDPDPSVTTYIFTTQPPSLQICVSPALAPNAVRLPFPLSLFPTSPIPSPSPVISACMLLTCSQTIVKTSWWGCGQHVPNVMDKVAPEQQCTCEPKIEKEGKMYPPMANKANWLPEWICQKIAKK